MVVELDFVVGMFHNRAFSLWSLIFSFLLGVWVASIIFEKPSFDFIRPKVYLYSFGDWENPEAIHLKKVQLVQKNANELRDYGYLKFPVLLVEKRFLDLAFSKRPRCKEIILDGKVFCAIESNFKYRVFFNSPRKECEAIIFNSPNSEQFYVVNSKKAIIGKLFKLKVFYVGAGEFPWVYDCVDENVRHCLDNNLSLDACNVPEECKDEKKLEEIRSTVMRLINKYRIEKLPSLVVDCGDSATVWYVFDDVEKEICSGDYGVFCAFN